MKNLRNRVQLIGHLGQDPETGESQAGTKFVRFSIATNESYKNDKGEKTEDTQWHNVTAWGKTAEIVENHCSKGDHVAIEAKLKHRDYDREDGTKVYVTDIVAHEILMLGKQRT